MEDTNLNSSEFDLDRLRAGDNVEFTKLVEATSSQIFRTGMRILGDKQAAEDVLQETYLKAIKALPNFEGRSSVKTWLYRIAVNEALMVLRDKKRVQLDPILEESDEDEIPAPRDLRDWSPLPEELIRRSELTRYLDEAVLQLPENLRFVFILRDIHELSIAETAELLGITEANTKVRLLRARLKLRELLSEYFSERIERR